MEDTDIKQNIYIKAMEIGFKHQVDGIKYGNIKNELEKALNFEFSSSSEYAFLTWFLHYFTSNDTSISISEKATNDFLLTVNKYFKSHPEGLPELYYNKILATIFFIKGEAVKQYTDYLELEQAKKIGNRAYGKSVLSNRLSIISIFLVIVFFTIPMGIDFFKKDNYKPQEVIIIEDETKHFDEKKFKKEIIDSIMNFLNEKKLDSLNNNSD